MTDTISLLDEIVGNKGGEPKLASRLMLYSAIKEVILATSIHEITMKEVKCPL
jgi:hypothetical protein